MWFTVTKESVLTVNNPHNSIILSKPLPLLVNLKEEGLLFLNEEIQTSKNISQGQICWEISIETPLITYILVDHFHQYRFGQDSTVVLSFQQSPCNGTVSNVCTDASIKGRIAEMSGFLV